MIGWYKSQSNSRLELRTDLEIPKLKPGFALIKVLLVGICSTDVEIINGYKDFEGCLGHEFVGIIEKMYQQNPAIPTKDESSTADDKKHDFSLGERVVGEINIPCDKYDTCEVCSNRILEPIRYRNHCPNRNCLGIVNHSGAFAQYISLPIKNLYKVDDSIPDHIAVFTEPVAAACRLIEQLINKIENEHCAIEVCIIGDGKLGLIITSILLNYFRQNHKNKQKRANITLVGKHPEKVKIIEDSEEKMNNENNTSDQYVTFNSKIYKCDSNPWFQAKNSSFGYVIDATGSISGFCTATKLIKPLRTVFLKSTCAPVFTKNYAEAENHLRNLNDSQNRMVVKEIKVVGSRCGPFPIALDFLKKCKPLTNVLSKLIDHKIFTLNEMEAALKRAKTRGVLKVLVKMNSDLKLKIEDTDKNHNNVNSNLINMSKNSIYNNQLKKKDHDIVSTSTVNNKNLEKEDICISNKSSNVLSALLEQSKKNAAAANAAAIAAAAAAANASTVIHNSEGQFSTFEMQLQMLKNQQKIYQDGLIQKDLERQKHMSNLVKSPITNQNEHTPQNTNHNPTNLGNNFILQPQTQFLQFPYLSPSITGTSSNPFLMEHANFQQNFQQKMLNNSTLQMHKHNMGLNDMGLNVTGMNQFQNLAMLEQQQQQIMALKYSMQEEEENQKKRKSNNNELENATKKKLVEKKRSSQSDSKEEGQLRKKKVPQKVSKYKGVTWHKRDKKWIARKWHSDTRKIEYLGIFKTEEEAVKAIQEITLRKEGESKT